MKLCSKKLSLKILKIIVLVHSGVLDRDTRLSRTNWLYGEELNNYIIKNLDNKLLLLKQQREHYTSILN